MPRTTTVLKRGWQFRNGNDSSPPWRETQGFPTEIHLDLMHHGLIEDPFTAKNEQEVEWVGEDSWIYQTIFETPSLDKKEKAFLDFAGLDTYATVSLNGKELFKTCNMFLPRRVEVGEVLYSSDINVLEILFESAWKKGKKILEEHPEHVWAFSNGHPSRLAVRKAQYHYGWDWGPSLMTCGPCRPIRLEVYKSRISDLHVITRVADDLNSAEIEVRADVEGKASQISFAVDLDGDNIVKESVRVHHGRAHATFFTQTPRLWYPRRYGKQPLYSLGAVLSDSKSTHDTVSRRFGIRRVEVVQRKLDNASGMSFLIQVNNIPIFCGGSNWIPADSFLSRLSATRYLEWVRMLAEGNQVMLRVWGGGIYEAEALYNACDEYGILIWQDFMFACGNYPAFSDYLNSVQEEAIANVKRLHFHPSIVIWAGNNEDYQIAEAEGLKYDPKETNPKAWLDSDFPARYIYEKILKNVVQEQAPGAYYHFGSPYGGKTSGDPAIGDIHQWNVWHGTQEKYQDWDKLSGRFVSEFGMQAFPDSKTVDMFFTEDDAKEKYPESSTVSFHNKAVGHDRRLGIYLTENLPYRFHPFGYYIYCTQVMQADCIATALRLWKRQWKGPNKEYCAGALVWQANDCWPCVSWSIADYYLRPKLAYYALKRELSGVTVGMKRIVTKMPFEGDISAHIRTIHKIELWVCNFEMEVRHVELQISTYNLDTQTQVEHPELTRVVEVLPNRSTEIMMFEIPVLEKGMGEEEQTLVIATMIQRCFTNDYFVNWPEPLKYLHLPKPRLLLEITRSSTAAVNVIRSLQISSDVPVKSVAVEFEDVDNRGDSIVDDNGFDLVPGRVKVMTITGLRNVQKPKARVRYLGSEDEDFHELYVMPPPECFRNVCNMTVNLSSSR